MYENIQEYYFPKSISDAVAKLQKHSSKYIVVCAGGINLTWRKLPKVTRVIDISRLGLSYIKSEKNRIRIGATTTLQELVDSKLLSKYADGIIIQSASAWSSRLQRNLTPLGGIIENFNPTADIITALLAVDAQLVIQGKKTRTIPLSEFYPAPWQTVLKNEFIREIIIPQPTGKTHAAFERIAIIPSDTTILNLAVVIKFERGLCEFARIAIGGGLPIPKRISELEKEFINIKLDQLLIASVSIKVSQFIQPISDFRASAEYRKEMAGVLLRRALQRLA